MSDSSPAVTMKYSGRRRLILAAAGVAYLTAAAVPLLVLGWLSYMFFPLVPLIILGISCLLGFLGMMSSGTSAQECSEDTRIIGGFGFFWPFTVAGLAGAGAASVVISGLTAVLIGSDDEKNPKQLR